MLLEHDGDRLIALGQQKASTGDQVLVAPVEAISRVLRRYASLIAFSM
jgi:hypothetical protein